MTEKIFPAGFPPELAAQTFTAGPEAAWPLESVSRVVEWLGQNGFAVLGTELWIVGEDGIQPGVIVNGVREIHGNAGYLRCPFCGGNARVPPFLRDTPRSQTARRCFLQCCLGNLTVIFSLRADRNIYSSFFSS